MDPSKIENPAPSRGRLKIFFGAASGVGKTHAMLEAAVKQQLDGIEVVVGYIETHLWSETEPFIKHFEVLPPRQITYGDVPHSEFDLEAALTRHPSLILVDNLAHRNVPGSRHARRWQDVQELLNAGINVYTSLNIQHLESLSDVISQITTVSLSATIPDFIFDQAEEVELIDVSPEELLRRFRQGKIYISPEMESVAKSFYRLGNLIALRELALRRMADWIDQQVRLYRQNHAIAQTWPVSERIMVCVSPSPLAVRLVRAAKRMAAGLHAEWLVVYVEAASALRADDADRERVSQTLNLAEQLGAETLILSGYKVSDTLLGFAHERNVNKIIIGKPIHTRWHHVLFGSLVDEIVRRSGDVDVYVISGDIASPRSQSISISRPTTHRFSTYLQTTIIIAIFTLLAWLLSPYLTPSNLTMTYLLGIVIAAVRYGRGASILASILGMVAFDFFFVPPYFTLAVRDPEYIFDFAIMLIVALVISNLTVQIKRQVETARARERRTVSLYTMSRELAKAHGKEQIIAAAARHIGEVFNSKVAILLPNANKQLDLRTKGMALSQSELTVVKWVYDNHQMAGAGTETLSSARGLYLPLPTSRGVAGVLGLYLSPQDHLSPEQFDLLETFANQTALAVERARLVEEAHRVQIQMETEQLRNSLLSSVSHDLRTPLASITGAISSLLEGEQTLDSDTRHDLTQTAYEEVERLNRLVRNLLNMIGLESGAVRIGKEWQPLEEVVGATLNYFDRQFHDHPIVVNLPIDLPLVLIDSVLIEQTLINLLENAIKYTPSGGTIELSACAQDQEIVVEIADRGPGLIPGDEERIFEKFYRSSSKNSSGLGLGLAICRSIIKAHGGRIWAENRPGGGAVFRFTLPLQGNPPEVDVEDV